MSGISFEKAVKIIQLAREEDARQNFSQAIEFYYRAIQYILHGLKFEMSNEIDVRRAILESKSCHERIAKLSQDQAYEKLKIYEGPILGTYRGLVDETGDHRNFVLTYRPRYSRQIIPRTNHEVRARIRMAEETFQLRPIHVIQLQETFETFERLLGSGNDEEESASDKSEHEDNQKKDCQKRKVGKPERVINPEITEHKEVPKKNPETIPFCEDCPDEVKQVF